MKSFKIYSVKLLLNSPDLSFYDTKLLVRVITSVKAKDNVAVGREANANE